MTKSPRRVCSDDDDCGEFPVEGGDQAESQRRVGLENENEGGYGLRGLPRRPLTVEGAHPANRIIAESENLSAKLIVAETRSAPTPLGETVAKALSFLSRDAANRTLLILDDLGAMSAPELSDRPLRRKRSDLMRRQPAGPGAWRPRQWAD